MKAYQVVAIFLVILGCRGERPVDSDYQLREWTEDDRLLLLHHLDSTLNLLISEIKDLDSSHWNYSPDSTQWSVGEVVEHLIVHDELFYRELTTFSSLEPFEPVDNHLFASDEDILSYREITPANTGTAPAYLEPLGRWCSKEDAVGAYQLVRNRMISYLQKYPGNLRAYYTKSGRGPTIYRDLHQLILISIAHTSRHHQQIQKLKQTIAVSSR